VRLFLSTLYVWLAVFAQSLGHYAPPVPPRAPIPSPTIEHADPPAIADDEQART